MSAPEVEKHDRQSIYEVLRKEISVGILVPGDVLKEVALSGRFGVSRTPVRDALMRLTEDGLLGRTARGLEVQGVDPEVVIQVYDMRILLEEEAAGRAAERHTIGELLQLEALLARDQALDAPDSGTMMQTNLEFHETIWKATHTPVLIDLLNNLSKHLIHTPRSTLGEGERWPRSLEQHEHLLSAIRSRDADTARKTARQHFEEARAIRLEILRESIASRTIREF
jgi:DNA-binding GntR family transcriptional regulator